jgi:tetratricopeptide (TPR) repeat protein
LHALSAVLLWRVLRLLRIPGAWLAGAIFAVHPVNVESVAWLAERKNTLAMFFYMLTLWSYQRFEGAREGFPQDASTVRRWYVFSLVFFLIALLSKTAVVMLPFVLLLCACWRRGRLVRPDWLGALPFFGMSLLLGLVTIWFQRHRVIDVEVVQANGFAGRLAGAAWAVWFYLYKALLPLQLSFTYPRWKIDPRSVMAWGPLFLLVFSLVWSWNRRRSWGRPVFFAASYYLLMLFPVLGFLDIYYFKYSLVADHWQYFSIVGLIALLVGGASVLARGGIRVWARAFAVLLVFGLGVLTWLQTENYATAETLWRDTLKKNPTCFLARNNLGLILEKQQKPDEAEALYREVLTLNPRDVGALNNLGNLLTTKGLYDDALNCYQTALQVWPHDAITLYNLGNVLILLGRSDEAIATLTQAAQFASNYTFLSLSAEAGKILAAKPTIQTIANDMAMLRTNPGDAQTQNDLGIALMRINKTGAAIEHFGAATRLAPTRPDFWNNLGFAQVRADHLDDAVAAYRAALNLNPVFFAALVNLGNALAEQGGFAAAAEQFEAALKLKPDDAGVHSDLGLMWMKLGRRAEAVEQFQQALRLKPDYAPARKQLEALGE